MIKIERRDPWVRVADGRPWRRLDSADLVDDIVMDVLHDQASGNPESEKDVQIEQLTRQRDQARTEASVRGDALGTANTLKRDAYACIGAKEREIMQLKQEIERLKRDR